MVDLVKAGPRSLGRRAAQDRGPVREFLAFALGEDVYGVDLTAVREILSPPPITLVPRAPREMLGVCSVRGLLVTVIDLRRCLDLVEAPTTRRTRILLTKSTRDEVLGVMVDEVRQVIRLAETELEIATNVLGGDVSEHVMGIGRPADAVVILLDLASMVDKFYREV